MTKKRNIYIPYGEKVMKFINKKKSFGIINQLIYLSVKTIAGLILLFFIFFISWRFIIDLHVSPVDNMHLNHQLKDVVVLIDIILCFLIYLAIIVRFLMQKLEYIKHLIECIHVMKGGNFCDPVTICGHDELSHLALHIDELRQEIHTNNLEKRRRKVKENTFLTSISHDLRTPLTSIIGYLEILLDSDFNDCKKQSNYLKLCLKRSIQLQELTNSAFEHFYLKDKQLETTELLRCNSIMNLERIIIDSAQILAQQNLTYSTVFPKKRYALVYDIRMIQRLFDNVFTNICRYAKKETNINITGTITDSNLIIRITNKIDIQCKRRESTGIGINNCKKIMQIHGGSFSYEIDNLLFTSTVHFPIKCGNNIS